MTVALDEHVDVDGGVDAEPQLGFGGDSCDATKYGKN